MELKELYHPKHGGMRVAGFMSGSGSNLIKIIEHERKIETEQGRAPYQVVVIFTDNPDSNAVKIGSEYDLPVLVRDIRSFYRSRGKPRKDLETRAEFDRETARALFPYEIDVIAYAGYMSIATQPLREAFVGVNVHPADLSLMDGERRKYTGGHAVRDALVAGERILRASTHLVEEKVDYGRILMISAPLHVNLQSNFKEMVRDAAIYYQNRLKEVGDWVIFPKTLEFIAIGRYACDKQGDLYFDGKPIPNGVRLD